MSQYTKYYLYKQQRRKLGSSDAWEDTIPNVFSYNGGGQMTPSIAEENSVSCGYSGDTGTTEIQYHWIDIPIADDYVCVGYDKYIKQKKQQSIDGGLTWTDVYPYQYRAKEGDPYEYNSASCGGGSTLERWVDVSGEYTCVSTVKYQKTRKQVSYDNGKTWNDTSDYGTSNVIEYNSVDCGGSSASGSTDLASGSEGSVLMFDYNNEELIYTDSWSVTDYPIEVYNPIAIGIGNGRYLSLKLASLPLDGDKSYIGFSDETGYERYYWGRVEAGFPQCGAMELVQSHNDGIIQSNKLVENTSRAYALFRACEFFYTDGTSQGQWEMPTNTDLMSYSNTSSLRNRIINADSSLGINYKGDLELPSYVQAHEIVSMRGERLNQGVLGTPSALSSGSTSGLLVPSLIRYYYKATSTTCGKVEVGNYDGLMSYALPVIDFTKVNPNKQQRQWNPNPIKGTINYSDGTSKTVYNSNDLYTITSKEINATTSSGETRYKNVTSVTFDSNTKFIGASAFYNMRGSYANWSGVTSLDLSNVTYIQNKAFYGLMGLTSITFGNSLVYIGETAFGGGGSNNTKPITSINLPNSVKEIGDGAFSYCRLTSWVSPPNVKRFSTSQFAANVDENSVPTITSITINAAAEYVSIYESNLYTNVNHPTTITSLDVPCTNLKSLTITTNNITVTIHSDVPTDLLAINGSATVYVPSQYYQNYVNWYTALGYIIPNNIVAY